MHRFLTHPSNIVCLSRPVPDNLAIAAQMHGAEAWHDARGQRGRFMPPEVGIAEALARRNWPLVERYGSITVRLGTKGLVPVRGECTGQWREVIAVARALGYPVRVQCANGASWQRLESYQWMKQAHS